LVHIDESNELAVGRGMAFLLLRTRDWVHRRVELIRFRDAENVERQMSVDFTLPWLLNTSAAEMREQVGSLVPLITLAKGRLKRLSAWDEERAALPVLTSGENGQLAAACLVWVATQALREHSDTPDSHLPDDFAQGLRQIAVAPADEALALRHELAQHRHVGEAVFSEGIVQALTDELARDFVMMVPLEAQRAERRVVKFSFEEPIRSKAGGNRVARGASRVLESLGTRSHDLDFSRLRVGSAESYHVEVEAPPQVEFVDASLATVDLETGKQNRPEPVDPSDLRSDRVHVYTSGQGWLTVGAIKVRFRAELIGLPLTAPALGVLTATILLVGSARTSQVSKEAGAALLLIGPTLLAAFLAGPGEHPMTTRLLLGVRVLVVLSGLTSLIAAGALAGQYGAKLECIWTGATIASCVFAALLLAGLVFRPQPSSAPAGDRH
jgi:hypothetical protein